MKTEHLQTDHFIAALQQCVERVLVRASVAGPIDPVAASRQIVQFLREEWAGSREYIARSSRQERKGRQQQIVNESVGSTCRELASRHGLSERHVRRICANNRIAQAGERAGDAYQGLLKSSDA